MPRTTLTLDDDVAARLRSEARDSGQPFRQVVNEAIRRGLSRQQVAEAAAPFRISPRDLGNLRPGLSLDNVTELLERVEGTLHR